jgi:hypothetical protein
MLGFTSLVVTQSALLVGCGGDEQSSTPADGAGAKAGAGGSAAGAAGSTTGAAGGGAGGAGIGGNAGAAGSSAGAAGSSAGAAGSSGGAAGSSAGAAGSSAGAAGSSAGAAGSSAGAAGAAGSSAGAAGSSAGAAGSGPTLPGVVGSTCDAATPCAAGLICTVGVCEQGEGGCTSDADCDGDTYCCDAASGCATTGLAQCLAYGKGTRPSVNPSCEGEPNIGIFDPREQCAWTAPPAGDAFPNHKNVLGTPMVADLPFDSGASAEIAFVSYNYTDGGGESAQGTNPAYFGVIRIVSGQDCTQLGTIADPDFPILGSPPIAIGDLDGDKLPEIVAYTVNGGVSAFTWNPATKQYKRMWHGAQAQNSSHWDGPSLHDLDDDGIPEVIVGQSVYDGLTGTLLNNATKASIDRIPVLADVDGDGRVELVRGDVLGWDPLAKEWVPAYVGAGGPLRHFAVADFGTDGPGGFDTTKRDGVAEIVSVGSNFVRIHTLDGKLLLQAATEGGGPPTVADFDGDGRAEVAVAGGATYAVFDLDCLPAGGPGCVSAGVRWRTSSQDSSSSTTGSSVFDFDGDGQAEAVYADECFTRVYAGATGEVLYSSYRTSCTWYENPVVADPDKDQNTEIIVPSNNNCNVQCPALDPIHKGQRCETAADCGGGGCDEGFCRCTTNEQCGADAACSDPLPGTAGTGKTCRAAHPVGAKLTGIRVLRDSLDRWVSSRPIWNQHAYSITNVEDDGTIPKTSAWKQSFAASGANNYRQNRQGTAGFTDLPDITGKLLADKVCKNVVGGSELTATVCNRGKRAVGAALPATFYDKDNQVLCTSYTSGPVPVGGCLEVTCQVPSGVAGEITMKVNDDGKGGRTTIECLDSNNTDKVSIDTCKD